MSFGVDVPVGPWVHHGAWFTPFLASFLWISLTMGRFKGLTIATVAWAFDPVVMRGRLRRLGRGWGSVVVTITICSRVLQIT